MSHRLTTFLLTILISLYTAIAFCEENEAQEDVFVAPKLIKQGKPNYPPRELDDGNAGVVEVTFMVNKLGKVFEPVIDYSSKPSFEPYALRALEGYRYKPATFNGAPVDSVKGVRVRFFIDDQDDQVSQQFNKYYKSSYKELEKEEPNKQKIQKKIKSMSNSTDMSPYSYRHLNSIKHAYAAQFSNKQAQIDAIYELLLFESHTKTASAALGEKLRIKMRRLLVSLLVQTGQYGTAQIEYRKLKKIDPKAKSILKKSFKQINDIKNSDQVITRKIQLNDKGFKSTHLFKQSFGFSNAEGVSQVKLRCKKKFEILPYQPKSEYKIPKSWGSCYLEIIGEPGSNIELYQL